MQEKLAQPPSAADQQQIRDRIANALKASFENVIEEMSGRSFAQSGVTMPADAIWQRYAAAAMSIETMWPEKFLIGDNTMENVFRPAGLTNVSDMQAVFNAVEVALTPAPKTQVPAIDEAWIARFAEWNLRTFGPGLRTSGTVDHIRKECQEIEANPTDPKEWVDIILLGINGLVRQGHTPAQIITEIHGKHDVNEARIWPDWRNTDPNKAIEHDRTSEASE